MCFQDVFLCFENIRPLETKEEVHRAQEAGAQGAEDLATATLGRNAQKSMLCYLVV